MIIAVTINAVVNYIDTEMILYAYDDSGLNLVVASNTVTQNPNLEIFPVSAIQVATVPTYADFVTATAGAKFIEISHATFGNICINLNRILRLEEIDSTHTNLLFDKYNNVQSDTFLGTLLSAINAVVSPSTRYASEDIVSDGTGVVTLSNNYASGTWNVFLRGGLLRKADVTETGPNELTLGVQTENGDFINVNYLY
jgi:hypothetical protein